MTSMDTSIGFDVGTRDKVRFAVTVLPLLGVLGGVLRATGSSEQATLVFAVPLMFVAFFGWRFALAIRRAREMATTAEQAMWAERDTRARSARQAAVDAQQEELRAIRVRQQAEQERLMRERAPTEQLRRMMERHRDEYEAVLRRRSA